jgi:hypothetical protein
VISYQELARVSRGYGLTVADCDMLDLLPLAATLPLQGPYTALIGL